ncbi:hypothetical protein GCM10027262_78950 [Nocardia tengchongensis]
MDRDTLPHRISNAAAIPAPTPTWTYETDRELIAKVATALRDWNPLREPAEAAGHNTPRGGEN